MFGERRRTAMWPLAIVLAGGLAPGAAAAGETLRVADWTLVTPLGDASGRLLYLASPATGQWRCEIAVDRGGSGLTRADLLRRSGSGWTVTGGPAGGFVQPWDEAWRPLGSGAQAAMQRFLDLWVREAGRPAAGGPGRWRRPEAAAVPTVALATWADLPAAWRPPDDEALPGGQLRRRLAERGRGRGGDGLVLRLRWSGGDLVVTSTRWPGDLTLTDAVPEAASVPDEAFLPLWPLAEFCDRAGSDD
ncbi:MAG TPA: hypothetical protein PLL30_06925 [Candidatus Krumholzibacteria bacterium]|nr:hypothetical protein [Candidatus Krumholzibacteria bacterium]HPD71495.1 hypothetical protein [Candidatus Krumholzibacteria bacterium]HRY41572.1 hypothetical protein [Candidatus Krumholzibacteria bacterium]